VAGLKQYSIPFPCVWVLAEEIETIFASIIAFENIPKGPQVPVHVHPPPASGSGETMNHPAPVGVAINSIDHRLAPSQDISWPAKSTEGIAMPVPLAPSPGNAGANRDFWPDGTPVPSRDVAWNLFDWMHQV
jgi:hypothetical protein